LIIGFTVSGDLDTLLVRVHGWINLRLDDDDDRGIRRRLGIVGERADAARDEHADVDLAVDLRERLRIANLRRELLVGEGERQLNHPRRPPQPPHVAVVEKRAPVIGAHRFVDALAVEEAVIEDGDHRIALRRDASINIDHRRHTES